MGRGSLFSKCVVLIAFTLLHQACGQYKLEAVEEYIVFTSDIRVKYTIPANVSLENGMVQLLSLDNHSIVTTVGIPQGFSVGELDIGCGVIDHAGQFVFRLLQTYGGPVLVQSKTIVARWPDIPLILPNRLYTLEGAVTLQFENNGAKCHSVHEGNRFWIELLYYGRNESYGNVGGRSRIIMAKENIDSVINVHTQSVIFRCDTFDRAGIYQVLFRSSKDDQHPLSSSNLMDVRWSEKYSLKGLPESILPCEDKIMVSYSQPQCARDEDKIRLYSRQQITDSSIAAPTNLVYIAERRAKHGQGSVGFECVLFRDAFAGYCFKYAAIAKNGAVHEMDMACVPTKSGAELAIDGGWSSWSEWGACSATCGEGNQRRYRTCDNPPPSAGGAFCPGDTAEWFECHVDCKVESTENPSDLFTPVKNCECGCTLRKPEGKIVGTMACTGSSTWKVEVPKGKAIKLDFLHFNLDASDKGTWVIIRDGDSQRADMLAHSFGGAPPKQIRTTRNKLLLEFMTPYEKVPDFNQNLDGFVARYTTIPQNGSVITSAGGIISGQSFWQSTVTIIGICLCLIIIISTIAFVCHNRVLKRRKLEKQQQAHQALLVDGELPNSPSHSVQSGSNNITFSEEASPTRRDYVLPQSEVVTANGLEKSGKHKTKLSPDGQQEVQTAGTPGGHSRQSSQSSRSGRPNGSTGGKSKPTSPISSPYAANAKDSDFMHEPDLFKAKRYPKEGSPTRSPGFYQKYSNNADRQQRHRRGSASPDSRGRRHSPGGSHRSHSPGSLSPGSISPSSRAESARNKSFKEAISRKHAKDDAPLAACEDLSPTSPTSPHHRRGHRHRSGRSMSPPSPTPHRQFHSPAKSPVRDASMGTISENIPLDSIYDKKHKRKRTRGPGEGDPQRGLYSPGSSPSRSLLPHNTEPRPPVEGRDASQNHHQGNGRPKQRNVKGKSSDKHRPKSSGTPTADHYQPSTPDFQNANVHLPSADSKPVVKPLPLRHIQRPDGQSPENTQSDDPNCNSPSKASLRSHDLSPVLQKEKLFPDSKSQTPSDIISIDGFEYDDYMPNLPGSYFTMDPSAYTLTWSNQPPWQGGRGRGAKSDTSGGTGSNA